jgi:hypothetical protein
MFRQRYLSSPSFLFLTFEDNYAEDDVPSGKSPGILLHYFPNVSDSPIRTFPPIRPCHRQTLVREPLHHHLQILPCGQTRHREGPADQARRRRPVCLHPPSAIEKRVKRYAQFIIKMVTAWSKGGDTILNVKRPRRVVNVSFSLKNSVLKEDSGATD